MNIKQRTWEILESAKPGDRPSYICDIFILVLISLNVIAVILETVRSIDAQYGIWLNYFEFFSLLFFTAEYILRVWSCTVVARYAHPVFGRLRYMISLMAQVDLWAILPFYIGFIGMDLRFIRSLRLIRLLRVMKVARYVPSLHLFRKVLASKKEELMLSSFVMMLMIVVTSSFMYNVENVAQPDKFPDIPSTMWWSVATLTTVGYGDIYPVTPLGKFFASIVAILGVGLVALPTGLLGAGFVEEIQKTKRKDQHFCPHCGEPLE